METPGVQIFSIALSPKDQEPRRLYLGKYKSNELYSISAAALRSGTQTANPELIANWTGVPYRMVMDKHGFFNKNYIHSWNGSRPFQELSFWILFKFICQLCNISRFDRSKKQIFSQ
ncbi:Hypothetical predicted protein [Cloeon dipterum]|uniref:Uncharacterized protein n=1 Tax=Cloeon dipterum TaxID=197152 RepID=A0A8S1DG46_9INSE|nr:Hypothetical predicted protein [Cloeon dipterum]